MARAFSSITCRPQPILSKILTLTTPANMNTSISRFRLPGFLQSCAALLMLAAGAGAAEKRIALVMGVWEYDSPGLQDLPGIEDDVNRFGERLRQLGFEVTVSKNPGIKEAKAAVDAFGERLKEPEAVGLFYFSGHGGEFDGANYLIPKTATISASSDLDSEALNSKRLLHKMETSGAKVNLVFLDCCRNEFTKTKSAATTPGGMAAMSARGTFIGFATASAKEANASSDGSIYTTALLKHMGERGLSITDMHTKVTGEVSRATEELGIPQTPFQYSGLSDLFYFVPPDQQAPPPPPPPQPPAPPVTPTDEPRPALSPWMFADSSARRLTRADLAGMSADDLWRARNEIYARKGYRFASERGRSLTARLGSEYRGTTSDQVAVCDSFNAVERANVELIQQAEGGGGAMPGPARAPAPRANAGGGLWLIADSSTRRLARGELAGLTKAELWRARNEIFARHGLIFNSDRGRAFTRSLGNAYQPVSSNTDKVEATFNATEQANVDLIRSLE